MYFLLCPQNAHSRQNSSSFQNAGDGMDHFFQAAPPPQQQPMQQSGANTNDIMALFRPQMVYSDY